MILKNRCNIYFLVCWIFYPLFMAFMEPNWLFSGEMWAESATNYFPSSISKNILTIFFATDAGYWAFCQRILAFIPVVLGLPIRFIPYFYTWSALLLMPLFVAPFCFPVFRKLVESDFLRFLVSVFVLIMIDMETATFISFTYCAIFLVAILTALAYVEGKDGNIPAWFWVIPFLIFTKPSIMIMAPLMFLVSFRSNKRFRYITAVSIMGCMVQVYLLYRGLYTGGVFQYMHQDGFPFYDKIFSSFVLSFKFLQLTFVGKWSVVHFVYPGVLFLILLLFIVYKLYRNGKQQNVILIAMGGALICLNMFLLSFTLPKMWNFKETVSLFVNRYTYVEIMGIFLIVLSLADVINVKKKNFGTIAFILWFVVGGFLEVAIDSSREKDVHLYHSKWQKNYAKDIKKPAACVPINPFNWYYTGKDCKVLDFHFKEFRGNYVSYNGYIYDFDEEYQNKLSEAQLESFLVYVIPNDGVVKKLNTVAYIGVEDGETIVLKASDMIGSQGGIVQILLPYINKPVKSVRFEFDSPISIGVDSNYFPIITWLGRTKEEVK